VNYVTARHDFQRTFHLLRLWLWPAVMGDVSGADQIAEIRCSLHAADVQGL
jgi:hypothetical protein